MYTKISAEFDNVDMAEIAARAVRDNANGVRKIDIIPKQGDVENYFHYGGISPFNPLGNSNAYNSTYSVFPQNNAYDGIERGHEAILEIRCESSAASPIMASLSNHGGLKIRRIIKTSPTQKY